MRLEGSHGGPYFFCILLWRYSVKLFGTSLQEEKVLGRQYVHSLLACRVVSPERAILRLWELCPLQMSGLPCLILSYLSILMFPIQLLPCTLLLQKVCWLAYQQQRYHILSRVQKTLSFWVWGKFRTCQFMPSPWVFPGS